MHPHLPATWAAASPADDESYLHWITLLIFYLTSPLNIQDSLDFGFERFLFLGFFAESPTEDRLGSARTPPPPLTCGLHELERKAVRGAIASRGSSSGTERGGWKVHSYTQNTKEIQGKERVATLGSVLARLSRCQHLASVAH